jgi:anti-sigma regulatory factor (Ser/Thr protein kinase)
MPPNLIVDIPRDARAPQTARSALDELPGIADSMLPSAKLLISELVTNSVKYGGEGPVRVVVYSEDSGRLRVEVTDRGVGFIPATRDRPVTDVGGWGLHLVETLSDRWGIHEGTTHVWFEMSART